MALAASASSLGCYALCGRLLQWPSPPPHACSRGLSLEGLGSVLAGLLGSPMGTASSFPNVATVSLLQVCGWGRGQGSWRCGRGEETHTDCVQHSVGHSISTISLREMPRDDKGLGA